MNDDLKIQTLMIYLHHWGKEQTEIRKKIQGIQRTIKTISQQFQPNSNRPNIIIHELSQYNEWYIPWFWQALANDLLQELGGIPTDVNMLWTKSPIVRFLENSHKIGLIHQITKFHPSDDNMRSVDAIVALQ